MAPLRTRMAMAGLAAAAWTLVPGTTGTAAADVPHAPSTTSSATSTAAAGITCGETNGTTYAKRRAPVRYGPGSSFGTAYRVHAEQRVHVLAYCDNSHGNRWYCLEQCRISESAIRGLWIWGEHLVSG